MQGSSEISLEPVDRDEREVRMLYADFVAEADGPLVYDRKQAGIDLEAEIAAGPPPDLVPPNGILLLARVGGVAAGLGGVRHLDTDVAEVKSMYVTPAFRGVGLGRRILGRLDQIAAEHGCRAVRLDTSDYLTPAVGLYRAAGYREVPAYNENPKADLWFERSLDDEPIRIVDYDPAWPAMFLAEQTALEAVIGAHVTGGIHHVGSTAVPGLAAKPIIDILIGVPSLASSRSCLMPLAQLGYLHASYRSEQMHWFCKPDPARRTHHLHLVPHASPRFVAELRFRDLLREDPALAREYAALKRDLAVRFRDDREAYTEAKGDFIDKALARP